MCLILFQVKLVKLITEKNQNLFLNKGLFLPCIFLFIIIPGFQFLSIYIFYNNEFLTIEVYHSFRIINLEPAVWINHLSRLDPLKVIGIYIYKYNCIYLILGSLILVLSMIGAIILTLEKKKTFFKNV